MKTKINNLSFSKDALVELNDDQLREMNSGRESILISATIPSSIIVIDIEVFLEEIVSIKGYK